MKHITRLLVMALILGWSFTAYSQNNAIRINQLGYYPMANKIAAIVFTKANTFEVVNVFDGTVAFSGDLSPELFWSDAGDSVKLCDFSNLRLPGTYKISIPEFGESYPFEISDTVLRKAAYASLKSYYYQRVSYELAAPYAGVWARNAGHPDTLCFFHESTGKSGEMSSPGGWYDAGDYGKYVVNAGISVATMLSFHENFNSFFEDGSIHIPESGNEQNDLLDEVKFELDWLKTMQDDDGGVFVKLTTKNFTGFTMPDKSTASRYIIGKSTASALDFAAMMAMAGRIYTDYDSTYAADCIARAENAWIWAKANPAIYFKNPSDVSTGEYGDGNVTDEFIWAASELYISTSGEEYKVYLEENYNQLTYSGAPDWGWVRPLASLSLATRSNGLHDTLLANIEASIISTADTWLDQIATSPFRIPEFRYNWGSNSGIANVGVGLLYAYIITEDTIYIKGAAECADYLLGKNGTGFSFVSSYGSRTPMNFHHRVSGSDGIDQPIPGFVAGGPNSGKQDDQKYPFSEPAKCFVDVEGSYASNEVCINWNSPMTALLAGIDAIFGDGSSVDFEVQTSVNNPPKLTITSPYYNEKIASNEEFIVACNATDPDGISTVELYVDSRFVSILTESPFQWLLDTLSIGNHTVTILAGDSYGLSTGKTNTFSYYTPNGIQNQRVSENGYLLNIYPNQVSSQFTLKYRVTDLSSAEFKLYDSTGKLMQKQLINNIPSFEGEFIWTLDSNMSTGLYYVTMQQNGQKVATSKLIKIQ